MDRRVLFQFSYMEGSLLYLGVHDTSRLEWIVDLDLPEAGEETEVEIEMGLEIPAQTYIEHDPWERLQLLARLGSPSSETGDVDRLAGVDSLRRAALAAAHRAKTARRDIIRTLHGRSDDAPRDPAALAEEISEAVIDALTELRASRDDLHRSRPEEAESLAHQRALAAEFLSNHAIDLISRTQRAIDDRLARLHIGPRSETDEVLARLRPLLARALAEELRYRASQGFPSPEGGDPHETERYLYRASSLKKHFQEILFLDVRSELANRRFSQWVSVVAAIFAALSAIPLTIFLIGGHGAKGLGLGLSSSIFIVILAYGIRERVKEGVRGWLNKVTKGVGRLTEMVLPSRATGAPLRVLRGRESFQTLRSRREDPLYPDLGATLPVIALRYQMNATVHRDPRLRWHGVERAKLVYRYDLSPLFSRLHDATEKVPVLAEDGQTLRFTEAPRTYRMPVELRLRTGDRSVTRRGMLVAHKNGLVRVEAEPAPAFEPVARPARLAPLPSEAVQQ